MKTKQITTLIAMTLGMLALFLLPVMSWQGSETNVAQAQGPDVGVAGVASSTLTIENPVNIDACSTGTSDLLIQHENAISGDIGTLDLSINFPQDKVEFISVVGVNITTVTETVTTKVTPRGSTDVANQTGILDLNVTFKSPGTTITDTGLGVISPATTFAKITWKAKDAGTGQLSFLSAFGSDVGGVGGLRPKELGPAANITVKAPQSNVFIGTQPNDPARYDIYVGESVATDVRIDKVCNITQFQAEVTYDPAVVKVTDITPGTVWGNGPTDKTTFSNGVIKFDITTSTPLNTGGILAQISWEGIAEGQSPQDFTANSVKLFSSGTLISPAPTSNNGGIIYVIPKEIVINDDNASTNDPMSTITVNGLRDGNNYVSMRLWNDGDTEPTDWQTLAQTINNHELLKGPAGIRTVNVRFLSSSFQESIIYKDTIQLTVDHNGTNPTVQPTAIPTGQPTVTSTVVPTVQPTAIPTGQPTVTSTVVPTVQPTAIPTGQPTVTPGDITGQIRVQGRADNGDKVVFYGSSQPCSGFTHSESDKLSNATIGTDGKFSIKLDNSINCLLIYRPGHLIGQRSNPSGDLGYLVLLAGDVTPSGGDNQINITDLSLVAANYGKADPTGGLIDFDGNGQISITDISIVAGNYSEKGNVDNWY